MLQRLVRVWAQRRELRPVLRQVLALRQELALLAQELVPRPVQELRLEQVPARRPVLLPEQQELLQEQQELPRVRVLRRRAQQRRAQQQELPRRERQWNRHQW